MREGDFRASRFGFFFRRFCGRLSKRPQNRRLKPLCGNMLTLLSPAKINLFLRILSKRSDGYHEIASLFQAINFFDTIHFQLADADRFECSDLSLPADGSNLVLKALNLFRSKTGIFTPVALRLDKKIPSEAGLGGGSGNAATALWGLNVLFGYPATLDQLKEWSAEIGSDITFFLSGGTAYCTGRGEIIREETPLPPQNLWVVKPPFGLSTPSVYKALDFAALVGKDPVKLLERFRAGDVSYSNDLEVPAFALRPELLVLKAHLEKTSSHVLMAGSGTAFACFGGEEPLGLPFDCFKARARFINRAPGKWYC